jgi:putative spermidine/putrescine transport system ATP-binding protein
MALPDGRVLTGLNVSGAAAGAQVEACIRPERVVLQRQIEASSPEVLEAEVTRVIYFGDHLRLLCNVGGGQAEATVKLPLTGLNGAAAPQGGESVSLEFPVAHARMYAL